MLLAHSVATYSFAKTPLSAAQAPDATARIIHKGCRCRKAMTPDIPAGDGPDAVSVWLIDGPLDVSFCLRCLGDIVVNEAVNATAVVSRRKLWRRYEELCVRGCTWKARPCKCNGDDSATPASLWCIQKQITSASCGAKYLFAHKLKALASVKAKPSILRYLSKPSAIVHPFQPHRVRPRSQSSLSHQVSRSLSGSRRLDAQEPESTPSAISGPVVARA
jgi:hypothetical protein